MNKTVIVPGQTIGIIGGGQLGRMMAFAAKANGFKVAVLDPAKDSPAGQTADYSIIGQYDDLSAVKKLAEVSDVITYEFENIDANALNWLSDHAYVPQGTRLLEITQDRIFEKRAIQQAGAEVAPYKEIHQIEDLYKHINGIGYPAVLKTARGGYDGKGQLILTGEQDLANAHGLLDQGACVLEKWVAFEKELSVIISRNPQGEAAVFPVGENIHKNNILYQTIVPARISQDAARKAITLATQLAESLDLTGTLAVEMFLTADNEIYINELAPRPHNSGHYTIEACETSQFEQHIKAVCGWPLGSTELLKPAVMVNILGDEQVGLIGKISELKDWKIHLYGKQEVKPLRKMGHVTLLRPTVEEALNEADLSGIWNTAKEKIGGTSK